MESGLQHSPITQVFEAELVWHITQYRLSSKDLFDTVSEKMSTRLSSSDTLSNTGYSQKISLTQCLNKCQQGQLIWHVTQYRLSSKDLFDTVSEKMQTRPGSSDTLPNTGYRQKVSLTECLRKCQQGWAHLTQCHPIQVIIKRSLWSSVWENVNTKVFDANILKASR